MPAERSGPAPRAYIIASAFPQFLIVAVDFGGRGPSADEVQAASVLVADEMSVASRIASGASVNAVAQATQRTEAQVKGLLRSAYAKLGVSRRAELVRFFPSPTAPGVNATVTPAQARLLERVAQGWSNKQLASELSCHYDTVKTHLENIFRRIGVRNRIEAAQWYLRQRERGTLSVARLGRRSVNG